jgi:hypothetical protein
MPNLPEDRYYFLEDQESLKIFLKFKGGIISKSGVSKMLARGKSQEAV